MRSKATVVTLILLGFSIFIPWQVLAEDTGPQGSTEPIEDLWLEEGAYSPRFISESTVPDKEVESLTAARSHWDDLWGSRYGEVCYEVNSQQFWWCEDNPNR